MKSVRYGRIPKHLVDEYVRFDERCSLLYQAGFTTYAIAEQLKRSQGAVARSLKRSQTQRRTSAEAKRLQAELKAAA